MGQKNQLNVFIEGNEKGNVFTNNQTIRGWVELNVPESLAVSTIVVELTGTSYASITIRQNNNTIGREYMIGTKYNRDNHYHYVTIDCIHPQVHEGLVVFPPLDQRSDLTSHEHTLVPGSYRYPFSFVLPMNNECYDNRSLNGIENDCPNTYHRTNCPEGLDYYTTRYRNWNTGDSDLKSTHVSRQMGPSFTYGSNKGNILYSIIAKVIKPKMFLMNMLSTFPFHFLPADLPLSRSGGVRSHRDSISVSKHIDNYKELPQLSFEIRWEQNSRFVPGGGPIFQCNVTKTPFFRESKLPDIFLESIKINLIQVTDLRVVRNSYQSILHMEQHDDRIVLKESKLNMARLELNSMEWKEDVNEKLLRAEIPPEMYSFVFPDLPPSFETCNISRSYYLQVCIKYSFSEAPKKRYLGLHLYHLVHKAIVMAYDVLVGTGIPLESPIIDAPLMPYESKVSTKTDVSKTSSTQPQEEPLPKYEE